MLFFSQDKSQSAEIWEKLNFGNKDQNVKFRKLMGIKVSYALGLILTCIFTATLISSFKVYRSYVSSKYLIENISILQVNPIDITMP